MTNNPHKCESEPCPKCSYARCKHCHHEMSAGVMDWGCDCATEPEHGVEACYAGGPGEPYYQPTLMCLCGFSTGRCLNWEDAGYVMDTHIKDVDA